MPNLSNPQEPKHAAVIVPRTGTRRLTTKKVGSRIDGWASASSLALVLMLVAIAFESFGATVVVRKDGTGDFTSINAALESLNYQDGIDDVVLIGPGVYDGQLTIKGNAGVNSTAYPDPSTMTPALVEAAYTSHSDHLTLQGEDQLNPPLLTYINGIDAGIRNFGLFPENVGSQVHTHIFLCGTHITFTNLEIRHSDHTVHAIAGQGSNILFDTCKFSNARSSTSFATDFWAIGGNDKLTSRSNVNISADNSYTLSGCMIDGMSTTDGSLPWGNTIHFLGFRDSVGPEPTGGLTIDQCIVKNWNNEVLALRGDPAIGTSLGNLTITNTHFSSFPSSTILLWNVRGTSNVLNNVFSSPGIIYPALLLASLGLSVFANNVFLDFPRPVEVTLNSNYLVPANIRLVNNTFYSYDTCITVKGLSSHNDNIILANNIFDTNDSSFPRTTVLLNGWFLGTLSLVNNLFAGNQERLVSAFHFPYFVPSLETGNISGPSLFSNTLAMEPDYPGSGFANNPFSLTSESPAIGRGDSTYVSGIYDLDGDERIAPIGSAIDIGAQEHDLGISLSTPVPTETPLPTLTPTMFPSPTPMGPSPTPTNTPYPAVQSSYRLGPEEQLLDQDYYSGVNKGGSGAAFGRSAMFGSFSNDSQKVAFYALSFQDESQISVETSVFIVDVGDPSSWTRLTGSIDSSPNAPISWFPDNEHILFSDTRVNILSGDSVQAYAISPIVVFDDASVTKKNGNNYAITYYGREILYTPILDDGMRDIFREIRTITRFQGALNPDWPAVSLDGKSIVFADYQGGGNLQSQIADRSGIYGIKNVDSIYSSPVIPGTIVSENAPTGPGHQNLISIRDLHDGVENFSHVPLLSSNGEVVFFAEDWNNKFTDSDFFGSLALSDFDVMLSEWTKSSDSNTTDIRFAKPGNQFLSSVSPGGVRMLLITGSGINLHLTVTTLETTGDLNGEIVEPNVFDVDQNQRIVDPSGTEIWISHGTIVTFPDQSIGEISISTPISPVEDPQLPPGVDGIAMVRDLGPSGTTFDPPIEVVLRYTDAEVAGLVEESLRVFIFNDSTGVFDIEVTDIIARDLVNNTITIRVSHFSRFAIGGQQTPGEPSAAVEEWHRFD